MKKQRWTDADRRAFSEQRLRAQTIPSKRTDGPEPDEWCIDCFEGLCPQHDVYDG